MFQLVFIRVQQCSARCNGLTNVKQAYRMCVVMCMYRVGQQESPYWKMLLFLQIAANVKSVLTFVD